MNNMMKSLVNFQQYKPIVKRLAVFLIIAAPGTALTNTVPFIKKLTSEDKVAAKKPNLFFDHRCLGIKPPAP
jgi:hypothetical protein